MLQKRSYTYELLDGRDLLFRVKKLLEQGGSAWQEIGKLMPGGHVDYRPLRSNPLRSGYKYTYKKAGLDLTLYFPEQTFNRLLTDLDRTRLPQLKSAFQQALPERSGYIIREFKIRGILEGPEIEASGEDQTDEGTSSSAEG